MRIRRSDSEDFEYVEELLARNITEAVCNQFSDWLAEPVSFNLKADIYYRVREALDEEIEV